MSYECFTVSIEDQVAHIRLSRPEKRNAMSESFWSDLPKIIRDIDDNAQARCIVISADTIGEKPIFSAGIDVGMFGSGGTGGADKNKPQHGADFYNTVRRLQDSFTAIEDCRIPVIVAIHGGCIGGGVDLITACDIRLGTTDSYITIYEINVGMTADVGTFPRILNHMPEGVVRELAYTGRRMNGRECERRGLFNTTYDSEAEMMDAAMAMARDIASKPPLAVYGCKRIITYSRDHDTAEALDQIAVWNMSMLIPSEMMEALMAKGQKRPGNYADLPRVRRD
ncbi:enoyl-CoA hydratase-related protein [Algimonas porphyrae]|uniref:Enoyl-CoA hydratase n=1 Tax=Algimonas porphyrae TaxID=1128113 RepID=A0ABQ5UYR1_9PROT|nr:enoyl-CoA hydratase-related protein [Algimonas porphyrae]GLQ20434.1 enoyl-CoA hydratase [Algimonas porphyrae]